MTIDDLTIKDAREIARMFSGGAVSPFNPDPYPVGAAVFIRTVTCYYTGRIDRVTAGELVLTDAAWIPETGRFGSALASGVLGEVEPYPDGEVIVPRATISDVSRWRHALPREAK